MTITRDRTAGTLTFSQEKYIEKGEARSEGSFLLSRVPGSPNRSLNQRFSLVHVSNRYVWIID